MGTPGNCNQLQQGLPTARLKGGTLCIANQTGVDLEKALEENLQKKTNRDSERHKNNPKL